MGNFLGRELDFYIKNEVMYLDDVDRRPADYLEKELRKIKAIRKVAHDLIDFLAQFENFQKKLWLKKKFVIESHWCITLDRVPQDLYQEIAANDKQREEWVKRFAINEIKADKLGQTAYSKPLTTVFLKANDKLLVDTAFFPPEFKYRLLGRIEDLDTHADGLLVHSENFQALNLLQERYRGEIDCVYVDPPYNTDSIPILYKNGYKDSSWATLISDRLQVLRNILVDSKPICHAIDDTELALLCHILKSELAQYDLYKCIVEHYPGSGTGRSNVSRTHEYSLFSVPHETDMLRGDVQESCDRVRGFRRSGTGDNNFRKGNPGRPKSFYAILVNPNSKQIMGFEPWPTGDDYPLENDENGWLRIYPFGERAVGDEEKPERVWSLTYESAPAALAEGRLRCTDNYVIQRLYSDDERRELLPSLWQDSKFSAVAHGTNLIQSMFNNASAFSYPKSLFTVVRAIEAMIYNKPDAMILDYFAGSGTTGHAVIKLNRESNSKRKYALVEMGEYFETVTKPRILKAAYSNNWEDGKPTTRDTGVSHCFKYIRLESYEDALNNLELEDREADLLGMPAKVSQDYMLRYALDVETRKSLLNLQRFVDPFNASLKIYSRQTGEAEPTTIDLPETFNYLLGLRVRSMQMRDGFLVIEGENPAAETVLVIWRNVNEKDNNALATFVTKTLRINPADTEYAVIYINGDTTLDDPHKKIHLTEQAFHNLMFDVKEL